MSDFIIFPGLLYYPWVPRVFYSWFNIPIIFGLTRKKWPNQSVPHANRVPAFSPLCACLFMPFIVNDVLFFPDGTDGTWRIWPHPSAARRDSFAVDLFHGCPRLNSSPTSHLSLRSVLSPLGARPSQPSSDAKSAPSECSCSRLIFLLFIGTVPLIAWIETSRLDVIISLGHRHRSVRPSSIDFSQIFECPQACSWMDQDGPFPWRRLAGVGGAAVRGGTLRAPALAGKVFAEMRQRAGPWALFRAAELVWARPTWPRRTGPAGPRGNRCASESSRKKWCM